MPQVLHTAKFGPITIVRSWADSTHRHLAELLSGAFVRIDGNPIQGVGEITAIIPEPHLTRALAWWERRDDPAEDAASERPVLFKRGAPCYADTGAPLASLNEILDAFPAQSPFREAALVWWEDQVVATQAAAYQAQHSLQQGTGLVPEHQALSDPRTAARRQPLALKNRKPIGHKVTSIYNDPIMNGDTREE